jgi:hypothetical protein
MLSGERSMSGVSNTSVPSRSASMSSTTSSIFKRLSTALSHTPTVPPNSVRNSFSYSSPRSLRNSVCHSFPLNMPAATPPQSHAFPQRKLIAIPPTPFEVSVNPFNMSFKRYASNSVHICCATLLITNAVKLARTIPPTKLWRNNPL